MPKKDGSRAARAAKDPPDKQNTTSGGEKTAGKRPFSAIDIKKEVKEEPGEDEIYAGSFCAEAAVDVDMMLVASMDMSCVDYKKRTFLRQYSIFVGTPLHPVHNHKHWTKEMFEALVLSGTLEPFANLKDHANRTFEKVFRDLVHSMFPTTARFNLPEGAMESDYGQGADPHQFLSKMKIVCAGHRHKWQQKPSALVFQRPLDVQVSTEYFGCGIHQTWDIYCALQAELLQMNHAKRWDAGDGRRDAYYATIKHEFEQVSQKLSDDVSEEVPHNPAYHGNLFTGPRTTEKPQGDFAVFQFLSVWLLREKLKSPVEVRTRKAIEAYHVYNLKLHTLSVAGPGVSKDGQSAGNANIPTYIVQLYTTNGQKLNSVLSNPIYPITLKDDQEMPRNHFCAAGHMCYWSCLGTAYWKTYDRQLPLIHNLRQFPDTDTHGLYSKIRAESLFCSNDCMGVVLMQHDIALCADPNCTNVFFAKDGHMCNILDRYSSPVACCNSGIFCSEVHRDSNHTWAVCTTMNESSRITRMCNEYTYPEFVKGMNSELDSFHLQSLRKLMRMDFLAASDPKYDDLHRILGPLSAHGGTRKRLKEILEWYYLPATYKYYDTTLRNERKVVEATTEKKKKLFEDMENRHYLADMTREERKTAREEDNDKTVSGDTYIFQEICVDRAMLSNSESRKNAASIHVDWNSVQWHSGYRAVKLLHNEVVHGLTMSARGDIIDSLEACKPNSRVEIIPQKSFIDNEEMIESTNEDLIESLRTFLVEPAFGKPFLKCCFEVASALWHPVTPWNDKRLPYQPCGLKHDHRFLDCSEIEVNRVLTNIKLISEGREVPIQTTYAQPNQNMVPYMDVQNAMEKSLKVQRDQWKAANQDILEEWVRNFRAAESNLRELTSQRMLLINLQIECPDDRCGHEESTNLATCLEDRILIARTTLTDLEENEPLFPDWNSTTDKFHFESLDASQRTKRGQNTFLKIDHSSKTYDDSKNVSQAAVTPAAPGILDHNTLLFLSSHFSQNNPARFAEFITGAINGMPQTRKFYDLHHFEMTALFSKPSDKPGDDEQYVEFPIAGDLVISHVDSKIYTGFRNAANNAFCLCFTPALTAIYTQLLTTSTAFNMSPHDPEDAKPDSGPGSIENEVQYKQNTGRRDATDEEFVERTALGIWLAKNEDLVGDKMVCIPGFEYMLVDGIIMPDGVTDIYVPRNYDGGVTVHDDPRYQAGEVVCFPEHGHQEVPTGVYSVAWATNAAIKAWMWTKFYCGGLGLLKTPQVNIIQDYSDPVFRVSGQIATLSRKIDTQDPKFVDDAEAMGTLLMEVDESDDSADEDDDILEYIQNVKEKTVEYQDVLDAVTQEKADDLQNIETTEESDFCARCGLRNEGTDDNEGAGCLMRCENEKRPCNFSVCAQCMPRACSDHDKVRFVHPVTLQYFSDSVLAKKGQFFCPPCSGGRIADVKKFLESQRLTHNEEAAEYWSENQETFDLPFLLCGTSVESFRITSAPAVVRSNDRSHFRSKPELQEALRTAKSRAETQKLQHQLMMKEVQELCSWENEIALERIREMNDFPGLGLPSLSVIAEELRKVYHAKCFDRDLCIDGDKIMKPSEDCTMIFGVLAAAYKEVDDTKPLADLFENRQKEVFEQELKYALVRSFSSRLMWMEIVDAEKILNEYAQELRVPMPQYASFIYTYLGHAFKQKKAEALDRIETLKPRLEVVWKTPEQCQTIKEEIETLQASIPVNATEKAVEYSDLGLAIDEELKTQGATALSMAAARDRDIEMEAIAVD